MTPIYYHSGEYARSHGEIDTYRDSFWETVKTRHAVEDAIRKHFDGYRLSRSVMDELGECNPARIELVLAAAVLDKSYDGRFSRSNKDWAQTVRIPDGLYDRLYDIGASTHPAILDGFIGLFRKAQEAS